MYEIDIINKIKEIGQIVYNGWDIMGRRRLMELLGKNERNE